MNERQFVHRGAIPNLIGGILANVGNWWKISVTYASVSHKYNGAKYDYITIRNGGGIEETNIAKRWGFSLWLWEPMIKQFEFIDRELW